eukprot:TRINITY_DN5347_c0_g1_i1.p1 TRINITY_DN5347_c0_g1~~TRINITY_DN5347_c0_g1_i1.p1  ORF type:complete len:130 (+),score=15.66 TRINITY_DN5347_c0_g1_i1:40-390(+)
MAGTGVLVGLSWEKVFDVSCETFALAILHDSEPYAPEQVVYVHVGVNAVLFLLCYPAWRLYILPKTDPKIQELHGTPYPPLSSIVLGRDILWNDTEEESISEEPESRLDALRTWSI